MGEPSMSATLQGLIAECGETLAMESLGATPEQLRAWLSGSDMDARTMARLHTLSQTFIPPDARSVKESDPARPACGEDMATGNSFPCGSYDSDKDRETKDIDTAQTSYLAQPIDVAPSQPNLWHPDPQDIIGLLWTARQHAVVAQMGSRNAREHVIALEWQAHIELVLIEQFNQSVPDPDVTWDEGRRAREIETRINRLRWAEEELRRHYGGILGFLKRLVGIRSPTRNQLYQFALRKQESLMNDVEHGGRS